MNKNYSFTIKYKEKVPSIFNIFGELGPDFVEKTMVYTLKVKADSMEKAKEYLMDKISTWDLSSVESVEIIETTFNKAKMDATELKSILDNKEKNKRYAEYLRLKNEFEGSENPETNNSVTK